MPRKPGEGGFTLLEVLVAFIIAALALALLFRGGIEGLQAASVASRYAEAVSRAQSHLAAATVGDALVPSDRQGDEGRGFHWRVRIVSMGVTQPDPAVRPGPLIALYAVSAAESWTEDGRTRVVQLNTEVAGAAPPTPP